MLTQAWGDIGSGGLKVIQRLLVRLSKTQHSDDDELTEWGPVKVQVGLPRLWHLFQVQCYPW